MWLQMTSLVLGLALAGSVALGAPLHSSERGCNMPMEMNGADHMGFEPSAPGVTPTLLCCVLDCQEPAPTGTSFDARVPSFNPAFLYQVTPPARFPLPGSLAQLMWLQSPPFTPPETYIKNLTLLI
jgi:hypothetical protein